MANNPYAAVWRDRIIPGPVEPTPQENAAYAVGANGWDRGDAPYNDEFGWSISLRLGVGPEDAVDAMRLQQFPTRSQLPDPLHPEPYWDRLDADEKQRESDTYTDADGWEEQKGQLRLAPDPRLNPPAPSRITDKLSPSNYRFFRPFDQLNRPSQGVVFGSARRFNGEHFSMADHRRSFDVTGYAPVKSYRNTYRFDPPPWDSNIGDVPPPYTPPQARYQDVDVASNPRAMRLG
jgi:hypothetical protein